MTKAFLEITMYVSDSNRPAAAAVYSKYKQPFLDEIQGATQKELLIRDEDVQVLHGFKSVEDAQNYLTTELFNNDVVKELAPLFDKNPEIKIYSVA
ncbi:hypothetical protein [Dysgonomonas macrotermitis]|uniref:ABM domain-containing protein n=1 Tax=Dysgonomonas macrotermitis TaxID=1346286 RepID=A0A1M5IC03_9BACT|nr:hypothetical protein [Dysgonomonas macrotermitis]SHG25767.1 hypothetical protein SAMN05444362_11925 [Dysgonomonas macrotermitis]